MAVRQCDSHGFKIICILIMGIAFFGTFEEAEAGRPLKGEKWLQRNLVIQALPRGPVTPSGPNPCSNIPGHGRCTLAENEVNLGGHVVQAHAPEPDFPETNMARLAAASKETNDYRKQESSS